MQDGLFFRVLRRFNTVFITLFIIALVVAAGHDLWQNGLDWPAVVPRSFEPFPHATVTTAKTATSYDTSAEWFGTNYPPVPSDKVIYALQKTEKPVGADFGYAQPEPHEVNVMVLDGETGEGRWLFADRKRVIVWRGAIYDGPQPQSATVGTDPRAVLAMVIEAAEKDTNGDGKLTADDEVTVYLWRNKVGVIKLFTANGTAYGGPDGAQRYTFTYKKAGMDRVAAYSVPDFKLLYDNQLPAAPN